MENHDYDFSGWATVNDIRCSDGRTIKRNAFLQNDGQTVPIFWNHEHNDPSNILGHALLQNRDRGVYAFGSFNNTPEGQRAKEYVSHKDITSLSIFANELKHEGSNVVHGNIREVSLVIAGANSGAIIDSVMAHSYASEDEAEITFYDEQIIVHGIDDVEDETLAHAEGENMAEDAKKPEEKGEGKTIREILATLNEEQTQAVNAVVGLAVMNAEKGDNNNSEGGDETMKHNAFDENSNENDVLMHDGLNTIMAEAKRYGSIKESYLAHAVEYGIENIEFINTEDHDVTDRPTFINNEPSDWVNVVMSGVHNTPFAKIRMTFADITEDEARAKGYIKGKYKKEEVFKLLRRSVGPTTIYKKQKFDRDDLIDADFDVVPWIKSEMELKLDEEKARAYLFGDGRSAADEDKVREDCIIPACSDEDLFTIKFVITPKQDETVEHAVINGANIAQDDYQGSGNITAFIEQKLVTRMLLMDNKMGERMYKSLADIAAAMGVNRVVKIPAAVLPENTYGVMLDLKDYNVGMKNQGKKNFFDDFDIDYNQMKYLIETRQSGALVKPYSSIVLKKNA